MEPKQKVTYYKAEKSIFGIINQRISVDLRFHGKQLFDITKKLITNVFISMIEFFIKKYAFSSTPRRDPIKQITVYYTWMCFYHYLFSNLLTVVETEAFRFLFFGE